MAPTRVPAGTKISVYRSDDTLLYSYTTTATNGPSVRAGSEFNTGWTPYQLAPIYNGASPSGLGTAVFSSRRRRRRAAHALRRVRTGGTLLPVPGSRERWANLLLKPDRSRPGPDLDTGLPAVVLWVSQFPCNTTASGCSVAWGAPDVPVYAVVADPRAPIAKSRYLRGQILWQPHHGEGYTSLLKRLNDFGRELGRRSLIVCTSDEMAVFVARHRSALAERFVLPEVGSKLPAELADKHSLAELCRRHGMPIPPAVAVDTLAQLDAVIDDLCVNVMAPFVLRYPMVSHSLIFRKLLALQR